ncbi:MAG: glycosyltransferase family 2 protein [Burkholderiales bacterium]
MPLISVVIATFNRRDLVIGAIQSVLAQTQPVDQVIVIDDGSTDGTETELRREFSDRIQYLWQENGGVSAARNRGLAMARGRYLTLLDSDDRWHPDKTQHQLAWLDGHPDYGMVLCDVNRVDRDGRPIDVLHRRAAVPEDGAVLQWVLLDPALVPASIMLRREVFDAIGGFDTGLATGEDLDFHLRVARDWKIGIIELALVTAMRGHDGLSQSARTYSDYAFVIERFVGTIKDRLPAELLDAAVSLAWRRGARGLILEGRWKEALQFARRAFSHAPGTSEKLQTLGLAPVAVRRLGGGFKRMWKSN